MESKINYILGPVSLSEHYSEKYNKRVYIFGDVHTSEFKCDSKDSIPISDFLKNISTNNPDKTIDIFLEMALLKKDISAYQENKSATGQGFLFGEVVADWEDCLQINKEKCEYKNTRVHYTDVRRFDGKLWLLIQELTSYMENSYYSMISNMLTKVVEKLKNDDISVLDIIMNTRNKLVELGFIDNINNMIINGAHFYKIYNKLATNLKIDRQLNNIPDENIVKYLKYKYAESFPKKEDILQYFLELKKLQIVNIQIMDILSDISSINDVNTIIRLFKSNSDRIKFINSMTIIIFDIFTMLFDIYTMSRLFRNFHEKEDSNFSEDVKYAIIYTGELHSDTFRNMLTELGFEKIAETHTKVIDKCLDIRAFKSVVDGFKFK